VYTLQVIAGEDPDEVEEWERRVLAEIEAKKREEQEQEQQRQEQEQQQQQEDANGDCENVGSQGQSM